MTLSISAAVDHLVGLATTSVIGVTVEGQTVAVIDGWPTQIGKGSFIIGLTQPPNPAISDSDAQVDGTRSWAGLGAKQVDENYSIPCCIDIRMKGTQKQARDIASGIFDTFAPLLIADLSLGGALAQPGWAEINNLTHLPLPAGTAPELARRHLITFTVRCRSRTTF